MAIENQIHLVPPANSKENDAAPLRFHTSRLRQMFTPTLRKRCGATLPQFKKWEQPQSDQPVLLARSFRDIAKIDAASTPFLIEISHSEFGRLALPETS